MRRFDFEVLPMGINNRNYPGAFTGNVEMVIKSILYGKTLHLYSGTSLIGDERVDIEHPNATLNIRVEDFLQNDNRQWDWVLLDPPYAIQRANLKLKDYGEKDSLSGNVKWRRILKWYCAKHTENVLWLDFCAPNYPGFYRKKLWLFMPGGYHTVRVLSWLKREMKPLL